MWLRNWFWKSLITTTQACKKMLACLILFYCKSFLGKTQAIQHEKSPIDKPLWINEPALCWMTERLFCSPLCCRCICKRSWLFVTAVFHHNFLSVYDQLILEAQNKLRGKWFSRNMVAMGIGTRSPALNWKS